MFGLFRKKRQADIVANNLSAVGTDMHSHLLPGIDDGAPDAETSIELIRGLMDLGYRKFITTPHIYSDLYPNSRDSILSAQEVLLRKLEAEGLSVDIHAAAEYFMDEHFDSLLANKVPMLTLHKNWVLVEFSFLAPPPDLDDKIFNLHMAGYQPVIAHPERYGFLHAKKEAYHRFRDQGCLLQVNLLSLSGYYGKPVMDAAHWMVQEGLVDLLGTDLHHERHLQAMSDPKLYAAVQELIEGGRLRNGEL